MSNKLARRLASVVPGIILISENAEAMKMFGGKTLAQVGQEFDLTDEDVVFREVLVGGGRNYQAIQVTINGTQYVSALSRNFPTDHMSDPNYLLGCMWRQSFRSVKEDDGTPKIDETTGKPVLDETRPYVSFGKPFGITLGEETSIFTEENAPTAEQLAGK